MDYGTLALAVVGAVTGVAALAAQVWGLVLAGPRVRVAVASAFVPGRDGWLLSVAVSNVGRLPVTVLDVGTAFRARGKWMHAPLAATPGGAFHGPPLPHRLVDGEATTWLLEPGPLAGALGEHGAREVRAYVRLATGKTLRSRKTLDVANLATLA